MRFKKAFNEKEQFNYQKHDFVLFENCLSINFHISYMKLYNKHFFLEKIRKSKNQLKHCLDNFKMSLIKVFSD